MGKAKGITFGIIGDGAAAQNHKYAIESLGGNISIVIDPPNGKTDWTKLYDCDVTVIASPTDTHLNWLNQVLSINQRGFVLVEKPFCLPWEDPSLLYDPRVRVVLQLRYLVPDFSMIKSVTAHMVRDKKYFESWKGDWTRTGGSVFNLFIHYFDLAMLAGCPFFGSLASPNMNIAQSRSIMLHDRVDDAIMNIDAQAIKECYIRMYEDVIDTKGQRLVLDIRRLHWMLDKMVTVSGADMNMMNCGVEWFSHSGFKVYSMLGGS